MSAEKVKKYFEKFNIADRIITFDTPISNVELAAKALNCKPERIAKSLSFIVNDSPIIIVMSGDVKVDNAKYRHEFLVKAKMIAFDDVEKLTGHEAGGVCPFAVNDNVVIYLDESLKKFETVFPACGSITTCIKLTIEELEKYSNYVKWVSVSKSIVE